MFAGFHFASRQANLVHLMGELTAEEFKTGEVSTKRLAHIKNEMGRFRAEEQLSGIMAKTSVGSATRQFRSWAIPFAAQTIRNLNQLQKIVRKEGLKKGVMSREFGELFRTTVPALLILIALYNVYDELEKKKNRTFAEQLAYKAMSELMTGLSALTPSTFSSPLVLADWLKQTVEGLSKFSSALVSGKRTKEGEIPGLSQIERALVPAILSQFKNKGGDELDKMLAEQQSEKDEFRNEAEEKWAEMKKVSEKSKEEAKAAFTQLIKDDPELAQKVSDIAKEEKLGLTDIDRKIKRLDIGNGERARYIFSQVQKLKTKEEKRAYVGDLITKGVVTDKVSAQIVEMVNENKPVFPEDKEISQTGTIHSIKVYAEAIGTNPITAFNRIFTGQKIRRVDNGAIIVERMSLKDSQKVKTERGGNNPTMKLDHTIPLELGGDNDAEDNLKMVTTAEWESYTPVENYLARQLRAGKITKKEAQKLIVQFKNGEISASDIIK